MARPTAAREAVCIECSETFTAYRSDVKFCSSRCQKAASRRRAEARPPDPPPSGVEGAVYTATLKQLSDAGRHLGAHAASALALASLIDAGAVGTAAAALARAHRDAVQAALEGYVEPTGPNILDDLREQHQQRRAAAARWVQDKREGWSS